MKGEGRRTRFERRVELERAFLGVVNRRFADGFSPLAGMTGKSIAAWRDANDKLVDQETLDFVVSSLIEAARRAELLADNSKQTFEPSTEVDRSSIDRILVRLTDQLRVD